MWRNWKSFTLLVRMWNGAATMENSMEGSQKLKTELPYDLTYGSMTKIIEMQILKTYLHPHVHGSIIHNYSKIWKQPNRSSTNEWRKKIYIKWDIIQPSKRETLPFTTTWMNVEDIIVKHAGHRKTNTARFHFYEESKIVKFTEAENIIMFARG